MGKTIGPLSRGKVVNWIDGRQGVSNRQRDSLASRERQPSWSKKARSREQQRADFGTDEEARSFRNAIWNRLIKFKKYEDINQLSTGDLVKILAKHEEGERPWKESKPNLQ